jgi:phosphohistidine phosphatase
MDDPVVWAKRIDEMDEDIMLVGHLPYMAQPEGLLLCGHEKKTCINFTMG